MYYLKKNKLLLFISLFCIAYSILSCQSEEQIKLEQYFIGGKEIYEQNCANCHQKDGSGFKALYPPIAGSDFLKDKRQVIQIIKFGSSAPMMVNGKLYHQEMPANPQLQKLDLAELVTFIYNEWGNEKKITEISEIEQALNKK